MRRWRRLHNRLDNRWRCLHRRRGPRRYRLWWRSGRWLGRWRRREILARIRRRTPEAQLIRERPGRRVVVTGERTTPSTPWFRRRNVVFVLDHNLAPRVEATLSKRGLLYAGLLFNLEHVFASATGLPEARAARYGLVPRIPTLWSHVRYPRFSRELSRLGFGPLRLPRDRSLIVLIRQSRALHAHEHILRLAHIRCLGREGSDDWPNGRGVDDVGIVVRCHPARPRSPSLQVALEAGSSEGPERILAVWERSHA